MNLAKNETFNLQLFTGDANPASARVYARVNGVVPPDSSLVGSIRGPFSEDAQTLPATYEFQFLGNDPYPLADCLIPDPCFWSPRTPYTYQINLQLNCSGECFAKLEQTFGVRPLASRDSDVVLSASRWVARGVSPETCPSQSILDCKKTTSIAWLSHPSNEVCLQAVTTGVAIMAEISREPETVKQELMRLSRWPSVVAVLLSDAGPIEDFLPLVRSSFLLVHRVASDAVVESPAWCDALLGEIGEISEAGSRFAQRFSSVSCPVFAQRALPRETGLKQAREACDLLQQDLAPFGQFAGYFV